MSVKNNKTRRRQQDFLLTLFDKEDKYQVKEMNDFVLTKRFNRSVGKWEVAIFTEESYENSNPKFQSKLFK